MSWAEIVKQMKGKMVQQIRARHDAARLSYKIKEVISETPIEDMHSLKKLVMDFMQHQYRHAILDNPESDNLPDYLLWQEICEILENKYSGGLSGVLHAARLGVNGGIRGIIETLYAHLKSEHERAFRDHVFNENIAATNWNKKVRVASQFLRGVEGVVPKEKQVYAEEVAPRLREIIEGYVRQTSVFKGKRPGARR